MFDNPNHSEALEFILRAEQCYAGLMQTAPRGQGPGTVEEINLGGCLLYVGEFDEQARAFVVAGNVAGAATLTATSDPSAQKQAIRQGIVDFLVTSLDEALRILKNEIRKRNAVAVCVGAAPAAVKCEMIERGVMPNLVARRVDAGAEAPSFGTGAREVSPLPADKASPLLIWEVKEAPARWMPKLDAIALDCLAPAEVESRRWVRLAPRYCGRHAEGIRVLRCASDSAARFADRLTTAIKMAELAGVQLRVRSSDGKDLIATAK